MAIISELHHPGLGAPARLARFDRERVGRLRSALAQSKPVEMAGEQRRKVLFGLGDCRNRSLHVMSLAQRSGAGD